MDTRSLSAWSSSTIERQELCRQLARRQRALIRAIGIGDEESGCAVEACTDERELPVIGRPPDRAVNVVDEPLRAASEERHAPECHRARFSTDKIHKAPIR